MSDQANDFLFGGMEADDATMSVFDKKTTQADGIFRPSLKDAKDKKLGYRATFRFLPNLLESGKLGPIAVEKHLHYVDMKNEPGLAGYYDCGKNHGSDCPLCTEFWKLKNSKNAADNAKSDMLKRSTKYYSYIMVIEDEQHPELVGKILVYPYGFTIKEKINAERNGEVNSPNNVFDLVNGRDFKLIIKEKGGFANYDASQFLETSAIKLFNEKNGKFMVAPTYANKDGKAMIGFEGDAKKSTGVQNKIREFLDAKDVNLTDHEAVKWDEQVTGKVNSILAILSGNVDYVANQQTNTSNDTTASNATDDFDGGETDSDSFFDLEEDEA